MLRHALAHVPPVQPGARSRAVPVPHPPPDTSAMWTSCSSACPALPAFLCCCCCYRSVWRDGRAPGPSPPEPQPSPSRVLKGDVGKQDSSNLAVISRGTGEGAVL